MPFLCKWFLSNIYTPMDASESNLCMQTGAARPQTKMLLISRRHTLPSELSLLGGTKVALLMLKDANGCCCWTEYLSPSTVTQGRLCLAFGFQEVYRLPSVQLEFLMPTCCCVSQLSLFNKWKIFPWCEKMMRKATQRVYMRSQVINERWVWSAIIWWVMALMSKQSLYMSQKQQRYSQNSSIWHPGNVSWLEWEHKLF